MNDAPPRNDAQPATQVDRRGRRIGHGLVALQLALIAGLALWAAPAFVSGHAGVAAWMLAAAAAVLGVWALSCNRPGNFNIHPAPRAGGQLVQRGPYRWIRHPMYSAVLLGGTACAAAGGDWPGWAGLAALAAVLVAKAALEERWMLAQHAGYAGYRRRTARFIPGVF